MKRSPLPILALTLFVDMLGFGLILPLLPVYITHYGGKPWVGGMLMATFSTMQFIFAPIWGRMSDRRGRRPLILMSLIGSAVSYFFFGAASTLAMLFVARVASGILTAASLPTAQAYIADVTTPEKRAGGMAMLGAAFGLGFALGPMIGGLLSQHPVLGISALAMPAYFAAGMALLNFIWAFFMLPESHTEREAVRERQDAAGRQNPLYVFPAIWRALRQPTIGGPLLVFAFANFAFTAVESSFSWLVILRFHSVIHSMAVHANPNFAALAPSAQNQLVEKAATGVTSGIFTIVGITILLVQGAVMGGLARRVGENRLVMFGTLLLTGTLIGIALAPSLNLVRVLSAFIAVGNGVVSPSLSALITQAAGPRDRGAISGAQQGLGSLARIVAPPINNTLVGMNTALPFFGSAFLMGIAFLLSLRVRPLSVADLPMPETSPEPTHP